LFKAKRISEVLADDVDARVRRLIWSTPEWPAPKRSSPKRVLPDGQSRWTHGLQGATEDPAGGAGRRTDRRRPACFAQWNTASGGHRTAGCGVRKGRRSAPSTGHL